MMRSLWASFKHGMAAVQARDASSEASSTRQTGYAKALLANLADKASTVSPGHPHRFPKPCDDRSSL